MGIYTASGKALATAANTNLVEVRAGAADMLAIREVYIFAEAATALNAALFRTTAVGTAGTTVASSVRNPGEGASAATAVTLPTGGTLEAQPLDRAFIPAVAGAAFLWQWQPGFEPQIGLSRSLILRNDGASNGPAITWKITWVD